MSNLEKLMALGAENCHPVVIAMFEGKNCTVAEFVGEDEIHLTDAGRALLATAVADLEVPAKARKPRVNKPDDGLDLALP